MFFNHHDSVISSVSELNSLIEDFMFSTKLLYTVTTRLFFFFQLEQQYRAQALVNSALTVTNAFDPMPSFRQCL